MYTFVFFSCSDDVSYEVETKDHVIVLKVSTVSGKRSVSLDKGVMYNDKGPLTGSNAVSFSIGREIHA